MRKLFFTLAALLAADNFSFADNGNGSPIANQTISFTENKGQISDQHHRQRPDVLYSGMDDNLNFHFTAQSVIFQMIAPEDRPTDAWNSESVKSKYQVISSNVRMYRVNMEWENANKDAQVSATSPLPGFQNYYLASCPSGALDVQSFLSLRYQELYHGINAHWYSHDGHLKCDYEVSAHANYKDIRIRYEGATGLWVNKEGVLVIETPMGNLTEDKPIVFQNQKRLEANWVILGECVSFEIPDAVSSQSLLIDPITRLWGTYYDGAFEIFYSEGVTTDKSGNSYLFGSSGTSSNVATTGAHQTVSQNRDAFVVKFNAMGVRLWGTYYGGTSLETAYSCAADDGSNLYMCGGTQSINSAAIATSDSHLATAPFMNVPEKALEYNDAFLVKFTSSGKRIWGTYYGGSSYDVAYSVKVHNNTRIYMCGATCSSEGTSIATLDSHQSTYQGGEWDAYIALFDSSGVRQWGTYYGGPESWDRATSCALSNNALYIGGYTGSTSGIATPGSHKTNIAFGFECFVAKFDLQGSRQWGTYYGGFHQYNVGICADTAGNVFLSANTSATAGIASPGSYQPSLTLAPQGSFQKADAYLVKFNSSGVRQWATYYGSKEQEHTGYPAADMEGNVYLVGHTSASTGMTSTNGYQINPGGGTDIFLVKFSPAGIRLWATYYGGPGSETYPACATDILGNVFIAGRTSSTVGITTANGHQPNGKKDEIYGFLVKFDSTGSNVPHPDAFAGISEYSINTIIYPNPSNGQIHLVGAIASTLEVFDQLGRKVLTGELSALNNYSTDLNISSPGLYIVSIRNGSGITCRKVIVSP
jgi:hypothetical protein